MKKNYKRTCAILLFVILFLTLSCQTTCRDCGNKPSCPIEDLFIDISDLPGEKWEEVGSRSYRDAPSKIGIDRIGTSFSTPTAGIAIEDVYRFGNNADAENEYEELSDYWFGLEPEGTTWTQLEIPNDIPINSDEYRVECSVRPNNDVRSCWYTVRYGNDVILFKAHMIIIKNDDFFQIMELIDEKAAACVATEE